MSEGVDAAALVSGPHSMPSRSLCTTAWSFTGLADSAQNDAKLREHGIVPEAVSDSNPKRWNTAIERVPVLSPQDAAQLYGDRATFVVTIFEAVDADVFLSIENSLLALGCRRVVPFPYLFWKYPANFCRTTAWASRGLFGNRPPSARYFRTGRMRFHGSCSSRTCMASAP